MDHGSLPSLIQGRYRYLSDLGAGGMGRVVLVEDLEEGGLERALKWVPASQPASAREIRHLREFEVLSRFQHPHILRVFSYGRVLPAVGQFFTCEPLRGPPLTALVGGTGEEEARGILVQLLRALAFLHNQGWVHGDIKPENVCLRRPGEDGDPEACLLDFGIAHAEGRPPEERVLGTVHYISPERILGGRIDRRGDLYSLGVLAYHLLTGNTPFSGPRKVDVLEGHLRGIPPRPGLRRPGLSQVLEETVLALLEKRPADRPADAEEVLRIFQQEWGDLGGPEDRNTLRAYIRVRDDVGWREEIDSALQGVHRRVGEPFEVFQRWQQAAERFVDGSRPLLPSLYRSGAGSRVGMLRIRSSSSADLKLFRRRLQRELQVRGVPLLEVGGPRNTPFVDLVRGLPTLLPVTGDGSGDCLRGLAVPLRAAAQGEPPVVVVQGVVRWLASHARKQPLVILLHSMEAWEESFFRLLTEVACSEMRDPSLTRIAWLGLPGPAPGLVLGQWQSEPRTRSWCRTVDLPRFDEATIGRWFEARFGGWNAPTELRYLLEEESEGSPAVAGRLLTALVDDGLVDRGWSGWSISDLGSEPYRSPLVRRAIRALGSLNAGERQVLAALVILGGSADAESILHASGIDAGKMVETFVGLKRKGWLAEEEERSRYRLSHSFQRKAVRDSIEARTWREGNLRVAGRLLQMGEEAAP
ncbi:MAG: serine/threonine protein kinase, partial [Planctomycetota bacterium]